MGHCRHCSFRLTAYIYKPLMHTSQALIIISLVLLAAFCSGLIFRRLQQSTIVAYLLSGIIIGPHCLKIVSDPGQINVLGEIGVILLMFILGLGFPPKRIFTMGYRALMGGTLQIALTVLGTIALSLLMGWGLVVGVFVGSLAAFSSTAIVIKVLNDLAVIDSIHGRLMVWYLIIQDLAAVLMIAVIPSLAGDAGTGILIPVLVSLAKGLAFLVIFLLLNRTYVPRLQYWVASVGGKELFLIGTIIFCLGTALITELIGLSFALGAFLAGLVVSDSEFNYQIRAGMIPFRDIFLCIFFVALGMLLDPGYFIDNPVRILAVTLGIIVLKFLYTFAATCIARYSLKTALYTGIGLAQMGEFSFVIVQMEFQYRLVSEDVFYLITTASLLTMAITPFLLRISPQAVERLSRLVVWLKPLAEDVAEDFAVAEDTLRNHVVICGYGPIGITIGRVLKAKGIPFAALELNAQTVAKMRSLGVNCFYGDATSPEVLKKVHIERARLAVITVPDPLSAEATVKTVRSLNPGCFILVRTRFSRELDELFDHGADAVVQEEYEAGLSMLARTLTVLRVPAHDITQEVETIRVERDELTKTRVLAPEALSKKLVPQRIILRLKARAKEEAIRELVQAALNHYRSGEQETIMKAVLEREQIESTGIGDGIAIPHARTDAVEDICICLGTSLKGIDYNAIDGKPVHIMLLLVASESAHDAYVNTLSSIASLFNDSSFRQNIIRCTDPAQVLALINEREKALQNKEECRRKD